MGSGCFLADAAKNSREDLPVCPFCHQLNLHLIASLHLRLLKYISGVNGGILINKGDIPYLPLIWNFGFQNIIYWERRDLKVSSSTSKQWDH